MLSAVREGRHVREVGVEFTNQQHGWMHSLDTGVLWDLHLINEDDFDFSPFFDLFT